MKMTPFFGPLLIILLPAIGFSQQGTVQPLKIGERVPAQVWQTIRGTTDARLVILDFWATSCTVCMEAFPEMEQLQQQFRSDQLKIVLVNCWEDSTTISNRMRLINAGMRRRKADTIRVPGFSSIMGDTILSTLFPAMSIPHHVWLNGEGVVQAITHGHNATAEHVQAFLNGRLPELAVKDDIAGNDVTHNGALQPRIQQLRGVQYAAFLPYFSTSTGNGGFEDSVANTYRISYFNMDAIELFRLAFLRMPNPQRMIITLKNKERFKRPEDGNQMDKWCKEYLVGYELQGPLNERGNWQQYMQQDVNRYLGSRFGITGGLEIRQVKAMVLIKTRDGLLRSSGGERRVERKAGLYKVTHDSFRNIVGFLTSRLEEMNTGLLIDETGISGDQKVDLQLTGDLKNLANVRKQLQDHGLDIIQAERRMEVLMIRDR